MEDVPAVVSDEGRRAARGFAAVGAAALATSAAEGGATAGVAMLLSRSAWPGTYEAIAAAHESISDEAAADARPPPMRSA